MERPDTQARARGSARSVGTAPACRAGAAASADARGVVVSATPWAPGTLQALDLVAGLAQVAARAHCGGGAEFRVPGR